MLHKMKSCYRYLATGAEHIKKMLMVNTTLQKLSIHYNKIGDDGMSIISEAIKHNKTLTVLWAWDCGFSVKGTTDVCFFNVP